MDTSPQREVKHGRRQHTNTGWGDSNSGNNDDATDSSQEGIGGGGRKSGWGGNNGNGDNSNSNSSNNEPSKPVPQQGWGSPSAGASSGGNVDAFSSNNEVGGFAMESGSSSSSSSSGPKKHSRHFDDDDEDGVISIIPDLDEVAEEDFTQTVADAPKVNTLRVQSLNELEEQTAVRFPSSGDASIDVGLLRSFLSPPEQVKEEDTTWEYDKLFFQVSSEIQNEADANNEGQEKDEWDAQFGFDE